MDRFSESETRFEACLERAKQICELQGYLCSTYTAALDTTDLLRASVVLCVSAFDFLVHEIFRIEVLSRHRNSQSIRRFYIPFSAVICDSSDVEKMIEAHVREANSYKSFVEPGKYAEAMSCFINDPWSQVSAKVGRDPKLLKQRVRAIYRWRNRIAHEADINPVFSGVELYNIDKEDVVNVIDDIEKVGLASIEMLRDT